MHIRPQYIFVHEGSVDSFLTKQVLKAHPDCEVFTIKTNTRVFKEEYGLIDITPREHFREKKTKLAVLKRRAQWRADPNGRSTDFLPVNMMTQGCGFGCSYCYTERRHPNNFPKLYDDALEIVDMIRRVVGPEYQYYLDKFHKVCKKDYERNRDPVHPNAITFDLGCDSDCVIDNQITANEDYPGHIVDIMNQVGEINGAMTSFATKSAEVDSFIEHCTHPESNRIRLSIMPEHHRAKLEMGTSKIKDRLVAVNRLVDAGFEVHINLSPICVTADFEDEYNELLALIDRMLSASAKAQMAYEIIFLTHSAKLYDPVKEYAFKAHAMMTKGPLPLVPKWNKPNVLSYGRKEKNYLKKLMRAMVEKHTPYSRIRYMF